MSPGANRWSRRDALRLAGGLLAGAGLGAAAACTDGPKPTPKPTPTPSPTPTGPRFSGDPGPGHLYFGSSVPYNEPLPSPVMQQPLRRTMSRRFYRPGRETVMFQMAKRDREAGILPFVSMKPPGPWSTVADGMYDDWLRSLIDGLGAAPGPVMLAVQHEPENDMSFGTPSDWVAMQQRIISMARRRSRHVLVVPVLMQYTFSPSSQRAPRDWLVPDTALQGLDVYNPWQPGGEQSWLEFPEMVERARAVLGDVPLIVPEYGCHTDIADVARTRAWFQGAFDYAVGNDVVGLAYFDFASPDGTSWRLDPTSTTALSELSQRPEVTQLRT